MTCDEAIKIVYETAYKEHPGHQSPGEYIARAMWDIAKADSQKEIENLRAQLKVARHLQKVCEMLAVLPPIDPNKLEEEEK